MTRHAGLLALLGLCLTPTSLHALPKDLDRYLEDARKELASSDSR